MNKTSHFNRFYTFFMIVADLFFMNLTYVLVEWHYQSLQPAGEFSRDLNLILLLISCCYIFCITVSGGKMFEGRIRYDKILKQLLFIFCLHALLFIFFMNVWFRQHIWLVVIFYFYIFSFIALFIFRVIFFQLIKLYRKKGRNNKKAIYAGAANQMLELYSYMTDDITNGFNVLGYFEDSPAPSMPQSVKYLGKIEDVIPFMMTNDVDLLYCSLGDRWSDQILEMMDYSENNFVRFYNVPNLRSYLKRSTKMTLMGDIPILSIREEPLSFIENRALKRAFDVVFSLIVLVLFFPLIFLFVAIGTTISSPGPIFFKQLRSGQNGKTFWCYKFRSMRVNAASDTKQATRDDPRKTKFGTFLRKTSLDEIPQFINVLMGDMSVVGPRPHMLKHTEEYSQLISQYMVRHWAKPGITGLSQTLGFRGETQHLSEMESRVINDIWYIDNWTFFLDITIIIKTVVNAVRGEEKAY